MKFPVFNVVKFVKPDGFLTNEMQMYFDQLSQAFQKGLSDNGWTMPPTSQSDIVQIAPSMPNGTFWYATDTDELVFKINGALKKIDPSVLLPYP